MGSLFDFICRSCGYNASVCGGRDFGFVAVVQTMTCSTCRELVDVLIGREGKDGPTGDPEFDADIGRCPECNGDQVVPWPTTRPCPKCDGQVDKNASLTHLWD